MFLSNGPLCSSLAILRSWNSIPGTIPLMVAFVPDCAGLHRCGSMSNPALLFVAVCSDFCSWPDAFCVFVLRYFTSVTSMFSFIHRFLATLCLVASRSSSASLFHFSFTPIVALPVLGFPIHPAFL